MQKPEMAGLKPLAIGLFMTGTLLWIGLLNGCTVAVDTGPGIADSQDSVSVDAVGEPQAEPHWFACERDADCVVEPGICQTPTAVNAQYLDGFRGFRDYWAPRLDCAAADKQADAMTARCVSRRCVLTQSAD